MSMSVKCWSSTLSVSHCCADLLICTNISPHFKNRTCTLILRQIVEIIISGLGQYNKLSVREQTACNTDTRYRGTRNFVCTGKTDIRRVIELRSNCYQMIVPMCISNIAHICNKTIILFLTGLILLLSPVHNE